MELAIYESVILSEEGTALRVADDDVVAEAGEHGRGDFAGVCALGLGVEVLGAELECRAGYLAADCREGYEGRAEEDFNAGRAVQVRGEGVGEGAGLCEGGVHFPVASDEGKSVIGHWSLLSGR